MAYISIGGVGMGVMAMIVVLSVMAGFDDAIQNRLLRVEPHVVVENPDPALATRIELDSPQWGTAQRYNKQDVIVRTADGLYSGAVAYGIESDVLKKLAKRVRTRVEVVDTSQGNVTSVKPKTTEVDFVLSVGEIAMGADLARSLGIWEGDEVTLVTPESLLLPAGEMPTLEKVKVRALLRTDVPEIDGHVFYYDIALGMRKFRDTASIEKGIEIRLLDPDKAPMVAAEITKLGAKDVQTWQTRNKALFYSLKMEKSLMGIFLAVTLLVSSFSVVAVLVLLVTEKRRDVGILKAIGATRGRIRRIFMSVGLVLGTSGVALGAALGLLICWLLERYPLIKLPDIYYDTTVPVRVEYLVVVSVLVFGALLAFFGALGPAWRISRFEPVRALRHDDD